jgi:hypothetical protein
MTGNEPGSDKARKMEPASPETYNRALDAWLSWELAIDELHESMIAELVADHDPRMPEDWNPDAE